MPSFDVAGALHAQRHASDGSDPITPASIGAAPDDDVRLRDTGWRALPLINGWSGDVSVRRVGSLVEYRFEGLNAAGSTAPSILTPPLGFGGGPKQARALLHTTSVAMRRVYVSDTDIRILGQTAGDVLYGSLVMTTDDPFPAEPYPGTPA